MDRGERLKGEETCQVRFTKWAIIEPTNMTAPSKAGLPTRAWVESPVVRPLLGQ